MYEVRTMGDLAEASTPPQHAPADSVDAGTLVVVGLAGVALGALGFYVLKQSKRRR